jgi:hypothetical protein
MIDSDRQTRQYLAALIRAGQAEAHFDAYSRRLEPEDGE